MEAANCKECSVALNFDNGVMSAKYRTGMPLLVFAVIIISHGTDLPLHAAPCFGSQFYTFARYRIVIKMYSINQIICRTTIFGRRKRS